MLGEEGPSGYYTKLDWKIPAKNPLTYDLMFLFNNDFIMGIKKNKINKIKTSHDQELTRDQITSVPEEVS